MGICKSKKQPNSPPQVTTNNIIVTKAVDNVKETSPNNVGASSPMVLSQQDFLIRSQELMTPDRQSIVFVKQKSFL